MKFRKKPVVIEAIRYTGINHERQAELEAFVGQPLEVRDVNNILCVVIQTLEGEHIASPGDWIIRGVRGEHYPCKPDIFEATYEPVHQKDDSPAMAAVTQALQQVRMLIIQQITNLAASPAYELAREVLPENSPFIRVKLSTLALHAYCDDIIKNRITLPEDSYEPHALYFRTFIVDRLRMLRPYIQEVERPA
jgi:hypothetical protein